MKKFSIGDQVVYIPSYILYPERLLKYPKRWTPYTASPGFITVVHENNNYLMRFWSFSRKKKKYVPKLKTISISGLIPYNNLFSYNLFPQEVIEKTIRKLEERVA